IGRGPTAEAIHQGLMDSPGHRANLLNPEVTHLGVGAVAAVEGGRVDLVITQMFLHVATEIDAEAAAEELLGLLNDARRARGAAPLVADPNLSAASARAAASYFSDPGRSQQDVVNAASDDVRELSLSFRRIGGLMALAGSVAELGQLEPALD